MKKIGESLKEKRVLITQSNDFMGPALCEAFKLYGAEVIESDVPLLTNTAVTRLANEIGHVDVIVANLMSPNFGQCVFTTDDIEWHNHFRYMVNPLPWLAKSFVPGMIKKGGGKFIVMSSVTAHRYVANTVGAAYAAARGAQISWTQAVGVELAQRNVIVNAIAQGFVDNPTFYSTEVKESADFVNHLNLTLAKRLGKSEECTSLAIYLASDESNFLIGQCFPVSGGWL
jgi:2-keto-3-deoxy-L-fuconate dehydrogenase